MKVLSGYTVTKTLSESNMDSINLPSDGDVKEISVAHQLCDMKVMPDQDTGSGTNRWRSLLLQLRKRNATPSDSLGGSKMLLFGRPLSYICVDDETLPKPVEDILTQLLKKGTYTEGVFRKPGNAKRLREIKELLDSGEEVDMKEQPVILLAALLKDFLRNIPGGLLVVDLFHAWIKAMENTEASERCRHLKMVVNSLPRLNILLLQKLLSVLLRINQNSLTNKMDAKNLAVCISPNLLQQDSVDATDKVTSLTQFLIENCWEIFGESMQTFVGDPDEEELLDSLDSLSLHLQDSAYDSTDPEADSDLCVSLDGQCTSDIKDKLREPVVGPASRSPRVIKRCQTQFNRRCSEPIIYPSAGMKDHLVLTRSHDDLKKEGSAAQLLRKQNSDDSFLLPSKELRRPLPFQKLAKTPLAAKQIDSSYSSSCSLESASSNISEDSVFNSIHATSPIGVPSCGSSRCPPSSTCVEEGKNHIKDIKRRSQSMRSEKKRLKHRWSFKKVNRKAEVACETPCQEDHIDEVQVKLRPRTRPRSLSAMEVFQLVDSRIPTSPPSYMQAVNNTTQAVPMQMGALTVQDARNLVVQRKARPASVSDELMSPISVSSLAESFHDQDEVTGDAPATETPLVRFRHRAMSESASRNSHKILTHRISQPLFEEFLKTKESYV